ncbi:hypothetical protein M1506_00345 [Patescibacteria group bacterium]|nr:hypothetical protein [Patescibacteria group bacterium]
MSDEEFNQKTKEYREKIEPLILSGFFDLKSTAVEVDFNSEGQIGDWDIVKKRMYTRPKV